MIAAGPVRRLDEGHPSGGPLRIGPLLATLVGFGLVVAGAAGCGPGVRAPDLHTAGPSSTPAGPPGELDVYGRLGFVTGSDELEAVGRFVHLPGPGDSTFTIFALSLPARSLRFRRDPPGFVARYRVDLVVRLDTTVVARLEESHRVRVRSFRETSRRDRSVVFQGRLTLRPGRYEVAVEIRDPAAARTATARAGLDVPAYPAASVTAPLLVYRADPRRARRDPPRLILNPQATLRAPGPTPYLYLETYGTTDPVIVEARAEATPVWTDTLAPAGSDSLRTAIVPLDPTRLPPGALELHARRATDGASRVVPLVVALGAERVFADYSSAIRYLRYSDTRTVLDSLLEAPPRERARRFHAFWRRKDPRPDTPSNEFFEAYFRRMDEANARFGEPTRAGWLTDRGEVYITLGPPKRVLRHLEVGTEPGRTQIWLYVQSHDAELRLVFVDETGLGTFRLTAESRRAFRQAIHRHRTADPAG